MQDPKQRRIFSADELGDLFTLGDDGSLDGLTDTVDLFQASRFDLCSREYHKWGLWLASGIS